MALVQVTCAIVTWRSETARGNRAFSGDVLDVSEHEAERLRRIGAVIDYDPAAVVPDPDGELDRSEPAQAASAGEPAPSAVPVERPAQVAPKSAWVAYAVSQGLGEDEAEDLTKAELVARFAG